MYGRSTFSTNFFLQKSESKENRVEERSKGSVSWRVYKDYILAGTNVVMAVLAFLIFLLGQVFIHGIHFFSNLKTIS